MRRALFIIAGGVSILLLLLTIGLWSRSYRKLTSLDQHDSISFTHDDPIYWIISYPGKAVFCRQNGRNWDGQPLRAFHCLGVNFGGTKGLDGSMIWNLEVPYWMLAVLTAGLSLICLEGWRRDRLRRRRLSAGCCLSCGYDLRASPERCPECGRALNATEIVALSRDR